MIVIDINKEKKLEFSLSVVGRFSGEPLSYFRLYCENFNIGFPAEISNFEKVVVKIPKISSFLKPEVISKIEKCHVSLEIINDRDIFLAFEDECKLKFSEVKASLKDEEKEEEKEEEPPKVKATLKQILNEPVKDKKPVKKEDNISDPTANNIINAFQINANKIDLTENIKEMKKSADKKKDMLSKTKLSYDIADKFKEVRINNV